MTKKIQSLHPLHPSIRGSRPKRIHTMSKIKLRDEESLFFQREALDIFTCCSNAGLSFHECLLAIMLTGFDYGINSAVESRK